MQDTKTTDTTFERYDVTTGTRQVITLLYFSAAFAIVAIETIRDDGTAVEDSIGSIPKTLVPRSVYTAYFGG